MFFYCSASFHSAALVHTRHGIFVNIEQGIYAVLQLFVSDIHAHYMVNSYSNGSTYSLLGSSLTHKGNLPQSYNYAPIFA